jgi:hypothetical protein
MNGTVTISLDDFLESQETLKAHKRRIERIETAIKLVFKCDIKELLTTAEKIEQSRAEQLARASLGLR